MSSNFTKRSLQTRRKEAIRVSKRNKRLTFIKEVINDYKLLLFYSVPSLLLGVFLIHASPILQLATVAIFVSYFAKVAIDVIAK